HHRVKQAPGHKTIKWVLYLSGISDDQCGLAEIIAQQGRQCQEIPRNTDCLAPKMAHVQVQGFTSGYTKHNRSENEAPAPTIDCKKPYRVLGIDSRENLGPRQDGIDSQGADNNKP